MKSEVVQRSASKFFTHSSSDVAVARLCQNYRVRSGLIGLSLASDSAVSN
jgi:hypothetical protein